MVYARHRLRRKYSSGVQKCRIRLMRTAIIKKTRQDEQKTKITTTNINYIQKFLSNLKKKHNDKIKIALDKTEIDQNKL